MARKRMLDPNFWTDRRVAKLTLAERLLFLGCISAADDEGRLIGDTAYLRSRVFPYDNFSLEEIQGMRDRVAALIPGFVIYEGKDKETYIVLRHWDKYQWPSHRRPSGLPTPNLHNQCNSTATLPQHSIGKDSIDKVSLDKDSLGEGKVAHQDGEKSAKEERKKTITAYVNLFTPSPPGVEVPYSEYPSPSILDSIEDMADLWGDDVVQRAIQRAVEAGKTKVGPKYIEAIIKRWKKEGKVRPLLTQREYEHLRQSR